MLRHMDLVWLWIGVLVVTVFAYILADWRNSTTFKGIFKPIASTAFIAAAITLGALESRFGQAILAGLALSWFGDVFLLSRSKGLFQAGLVSFLLAHVAYCVAFVLHGLDLWWSLATAVVLIPGAVLLARWIVPNVSAEMRAPVVAYMTVISVMVALAGGTLGAGGTPIILVGAATFYVSDIFVARDRFISPGVSNTVLGLPLYYAAQVFFAFGIALTNQ